MPRGRSVKLFCPRTGITRPECSCRDCLTDQIRRHQPALLEAEDVVVIESIVPPARESPHHRETDRRAA